MKNLLFTIMFVLTGGLIFSQGFTMIEVEPVLGDPGGPTQTCAECFTFSITFDMTAPLSSTILDELVLEISSETGISPGLSPNAWAMDSLIVSPECTIYTYTAEELSICFGIDPDLCDGEGNEGGGSGGGQGMTRSETVGVNLKVGDECFADYFSSGPGSIYYDQQCLGPIIGCTGISFTFTGICCESASTRQDQTNNSFEPQAIKFSPNPCFEHLIIENLKGGEELTIYSVVGEKLLQMRVGADEKEVIIDKLDVVPTGVNLLQIVRNGKIVEQIKFVKQL